MEGNGRKDRTEYFQSYYKEKKGAISERRKSLYKNDPEYRAKAKENARLYREKKREETERLRAEGKLPPRRSGFKKSYTVTIDGAELKAHTITVLAKRIGKSVSSLNYWTRGGSLPQTPFFTSMGDRLFTDEMIEVVKVAVSKREKIFKKDNSFRAEIIEGWRSLGIDIS